jgi:hypothetical protein
MGVPEEDLAGFKKHNPGYMYSTKCDPEFTIVKEKT